VAAGVLAVLAGLASGGPAGAVEPVELDGGGPVTDRVDALVDREEPVRQALERLEREHGVRLLAVYVRDFSGQSAQSWADATAERNGLGRSDVLLAVATRDGQYVVSADTGSDTDTDTDTGSGLTRRQLGEVDATAVEPALRQHDWAGAAIGVADGLAAVLAGEAVPAPAGTPGEADPGSGSDPAVRALPLVMLLLAAVTVTALYLLLSRRRRDRYTGRQRGRHPDRNRRKEHGI
jgi:uncharacterized membrane protein YgcG